ncbi:hypothetical protein PRUPE_3G060200 [Prunus persica]|uniref:Secreted protein n=1 Tax=Prunus persica TaxID=3760 RepID=A0A251PW46_PRUPE|nr:hypothetical protein PRUPE_3G060200 [Prunus persica]
MGLLLFLSLHFFFQNFLFSSFSISSFSPSAQRSRPAQLSSARVHLLVAQLSSSSAIGACLPSSSTTHGRRVGGLWLWLWLAWLLGGVCCNDK